MTEQGDAEADAYRRRRSGRVVAATLALAVVTLVSACGSEASPSGSPTDPIATTSASASASPTPGVIIGSGGGSEIGRAHV